MHRVASIRFTYSSVARRRMRIVLRVVTSLYKKNLVWRSCNKVIAVGTPAIRHIYVKIVAISTVYFETVYSRLMAETCRYVCI